MKPKINIYSTVAELVETVNVNFSELVKNSIEQNENIYIALAGGSTPKIIYQSWASLKLNWFNTHFFWGDERCVPPEDEASNYKMVNDIYLSKINIPEKNIHRIFGENSPELESQRYENEILKSLPIGKNNLPEFDWILLGLGTDGHTASLFPGTSSLIENKSICIVAEQPQTGQKRISFTLSIINNAKRVSFIVTGENKSIIIKRILKDKLKKIQFPAEQVHPASGELEWYLDEAAAKLIK